MGVGLLAVKTGFIPFSKIYQFLHNKHAWERETSCRISRTSVVMTQGDSVSSLVRSRGPHLCATAFGSVTSWNGSKVVSRSTRIDSLIGFISFYTLNTLKRDASYWTVQVLVLADFGCGWLSQLWRVTEPRPDIENLCGHDTRGILGADRWSLDNHSTVCNSLRARDILEWEQGC